MCSHHVFAPLLSTDCRKLAFEVLVVMSNSNAQLLRQNQVYMKNVVELSLCFLSLYDDDIDFEADDDSDQLYIQSARQWTRELSMKLGGGPFLSVAEPLLQSGIRSTNWKLQYAALQALSQIIPFIKEVDKWKLTDSDDDEDEADIENGQNGTNHSEHKMNGKDAQKASHSVWDVLVPQIMNLTVSENIKPPIKHSAFQMIRILIVETEGAFPKKFHIVFYQSMIQLLKQWKRNSPRVMAQCLICLCHFQQKAHIDHFKGVSDVILQQLSVMMKDDAIKQEITAHCVTAIGTSANLLGTQFLPYYERMMPLMMNILTNNMLDAMLRGKAMECIGMIGESVGNARFGEDAHKLMKVLLPLRDQLLKAKNANSGGSNTSSDDSTAYNYLNQLFARISRCIGDSFIQYFPSVIPHILESAKIEAAQILLPDEASPGDNGYTSFTVHLRGIGDTKFCINAVSLEEKDVACHMLYQLAKDQCIGFLPYVLQVCVHSLSLLFFERVTECLLPTFCRLQIL